MTSVKVGRCRHGSMHMNKGNVLQDEFMSNMNQLSFQSGVISGEEREKYTPFRYTGGSKGPRK